MRVDIFSHDTSQNTHLTLKVQAPTEPNVINKDIMNRGQIATSSFQHSSSSKSHPNENIFLSGQQNAMIGEILPALGRTQRRIQNHVKQLR